MEVKLKFNANINAPIKDVFERIADMPNYKDWLPNSSAFGGTKDVSPYPVQLNTHYLDYGPQGERPGVVNFYEQYSKLGFRHTMLITNLGLNLDTDIQIIYHFQDNNGITSVERQLAMTITGSKFSMLAVPLVKMAFIRENRRIMRALKRSFQ